MQDAAEALSLVLQLDQDEGRQPRAPTPLEQAIRHPDYQDARTFVAIAPMAQSKTVRINVTMDAQLLERIDTDAAKRGMNRSAYLAAAARRQLDSRSAA